MRIFEFQQLAYGEASPVEGAKEVPPARQDAYLLAGECASYVLSVSDTVVGEVRCRQLHGISGMSKASI